MASISAASLGAVVGLALWTLIGWAVGRRLPVDPHLRLAFAPALGWALQTVVALLLAEAAGFSIWTVLGATVLLAAASFALPRPVPNPLIDAPTIPALPPWFLLAAAILAVGPTLGLLPKFHPEGVALAGPLYDHSKIALIDEMVRGGAPPANPFFGRGGEPGHVAYYYLWHFGAAELALLTRTSGWEADIAATWFTAFASLALMAGLASRFAGGRPASLALLLVVACGDSLRPILAALAVDGSLDAALTPGGLSNWLVQTSWSPHHVAAASTVVLSLTVMAALARRPSLGLAALLALLAAAAFESSVWVGGAAFVLCAAAATPILLLRTEPHRRLPFLGALVGAAALALLIALPLLLEQIRSASSRGGGPPVAVEVFPVFGSALSDDVRRLADLPGYWLVLLLVDFPVIWLAGVLAAFAWFRPKGTETRRNVPDDAVLLAAVFASFLCGWLLRSRAGENNDLGWRAVLPAILIATPFAAAFLSRLIAESRRLPAALLALVLLLTLPGGFLAASSNALAPPSPDAGVFARSPAMWAAVRRRTDPAERVASNPLMARAVTRWPVNIAWALLADRRSCFAGNELAIAFAPMAADEREAANRLFERVFAGNGTPDDLRSLVADFGCTAAVVTPEDGAWSRDPFAASSLFALAEEEPNRWRVYRRSVAGGSAAAR